MYENNQNIQEEDVLPKEVKKVYNFLVKAFKSGQNPKLKKYAIVDLALIASSLMKLYNLQEYSSEFAKAYLDFQALRAQDAEKPEDDRDPSLSWYSNSARSDSVEKLLFRRDYLRRYFLEKLPDLALKDTQRSFTDEQRTVIFHLGGGKCAKCGKTCTEDSFHADHIVPHSKGGQTKISNGQLLCPDCNLVKGAKME